MIYPYEVFEPGDVILTGGNALISRIIRWITQARGQSKTIKNHAGIAVSKNTYIEALTTVRRHDYNHLINLNTDIEVWRKVDLIDDQKENIVLRASDYVGRLYGPQKIVLHAFDGLLGKIFAKDVYLFRKLGFMDRYPICSWVVSYAYDFVGYQFLNKDPKYATPDCIHDHLVESKDWKIVYTNHREYYTEDKKIG